MCSAGFISDANKSFKSNRELRKRGEPFDTLKDNKIPKSFKKQFPKPTAEEYSNFRNHIIKKRKREVLRNRLLFIGFLIISIVVIKVLF